MIRPTVVGIRGIRCIPHDLTACHGFGISILEREITFPDAPPSRGVHPDSHDGSSLRPSADKLNFDFDNVSQI